MMESMKRNLVLGTIPLFCLSGVNGRQIEFRLSIEDPIRMVEDIEFDPLKFTSQPSSQPSSQPTLVPSESPTMYPSSSPSEREPSSAPSSSDASMQPSSYAPPSLPVTQGPGFFNYNPYDAEYGFNAWKNIGDTIESSTWFDQQRFPNDVWGFETNNQCGYGWRQSPIDVCDGIGDGTVDFDTAQSRNNVNSACHEYHRAFSDAGEWFLDDPNKISMHILPSKLRLHYALRDCPYQKGFGVKGEGSPVWFPLPADKGGTEEWCDYEPPGIDFPHHWNGHIQPLHIDIKFPSEHTICGKRFDGEFTIFHAHPQRQAVLTMATLIKIGFHNFEMQKLINEWEKIFNENQFKCQRFRNRQLRELNSFRSRMSNVLKTGIDHEHVSSMTEEEDSTKMDIDQNNFSTWADLPDDADKWIDERERRILKKLGNDTLNNTLNNTQYNTQNNTQYNTQNDPQGTISFNPYADEIYVSKWFYGYWGSFTEPPCTGRFVSNRIMDAPMEISQAQYDKLTHILFDNVDETCQRTSADFRRSVARPIQPTNDRMLWRCNRDRWEHDFESWRCDGHSSTQFGCVREGQTMIQPPPEEELV